MKLIYALEYDTESNVIRHLGNIPAEIALKLLAEVITAGRKNPAIKTLPEEKKT